MATSRRKRPQGRKPNTLDKAELAIILSHAATFGTVSAAKTFKLAERTIQRHQKAVREGKDPKLAEMIATEATRAAQRNRSKLQLALDVLLDRLMALAPTADLKVVLSGVETVGDLVTQRQVLIGEGNSESPGAPAPEGVGGRAEGSESARPAVH